MSLGRSAAVSHTGRKRRHNEDAYVCTPPLFAIADGMGGARAGEVASGLAAAALKDGDSSGNPQERVVELIQEANRRIYERSLHDAEVSGMGTTMTVAIVDGMRVTFGHVGDSRAYTLHEGRLEQVTEDHSLVAELVRGGKLSPEEAEHHPRRSVITRALGTDPDVDVDTFTVDAHAGDVFLLCSDGLTDMVSDQTIEQVLSQMPELEAAAEELVRLANKAGGEDNITVVAFEVVEEGAEPDETTVEQTREMPAIEPVEVEPSTPMPSAVDTAVISADQVAELAEAHTQELRPRRKPRRRVWPLFLLLLAIAAAAVAYWVLTH